MTTANSIVKFAYFLVSSKKYYKTKHFVYEVLEGSNFKYRKYFDFFMIFLVLSTVAILIYEVNHKFSYWLNIYETIAIGIFVVEWIGRLWVSSHMRLQIIEDYEKTQILNQPYDLKKSFEKIIKEKLRFIFSPMSIIDLLAILPYYRPLRILRILMLFRLFKILRYTDSIKQFKYVFVEKRFEFLTLAIMFCMAVIFGSTIIFIYEGNGINPNINNFFDAVYWSVITISTVGFGDISPVTVQGRVATLFLVVGGMGVIAFFTSIVTTSLSGKLALLKEEKIINDINSLDKFIIICGYGHMGKILAEEFSKIKQRFIIIDQDEELLKHANIHNYYNINADATNSEILDKIGLNNALSIIAITNNDAVNLAIVLTARSQNPDINIIARANHENTRKKLLLAGASKVVLANEITALVATEYIEQSVAFEAIDDILLNSDGAVMDEIEILDNSDYIGFKLEDIDLEKFNLTLIGIIDSKNRDKFHFNPKKDTYIIQSKDILIVIGYKEAIINLKVDLLSSTPNARIT